MINRQLISLINFECYNAGNRLLGLATIDLPDIESMTAEISGAGIGGKIDWPVRGMFENIATTLHFRVVYEGSGQYLSQGSGHMMSLRGASEEYDASSGERKVMPIKIDLRGHSSKLGLGKLEPGTDMESELEITLDYLKVTIDGKEVLELDKFNYIYSVNGVDFLSDVRDALGL